MLPRPHPVEIVLMGERNGGTLTPFAKLDYYCERVWLSDGSPSP